MQQGPTVLPLSLNPRSIIGANEGSVAQQPVTLCIDQSTCELIAVASGMLPTAVLMTATADGTFALWSVSAAKIESPSTLGSVRPDAAADVKLICSDAMSGALPVSFLTWTFGLGNASNQFFVGTSEGKVFHLYRNCTALLIYSFSHEDGTPIIAPVTAMARHSYILAVSIEDVVHFIHLDGHRQWSASCNGLGVSLQHCVRKNTITSLVFDSTYPYLLWAGMADGSAVLLRAKYVDESKQKRSSCSVVRRLSRPASCHSTCDDSQPSIEANRLVSSNCHAGHHYADSVAVDFVRHPAAARIISQRGIVIIGSASCGMASYSVKWAAATAHVKLSGLSLAISHDARRNESIRCVAVRDPQSVGVDTGVLEHSNIHVTAPRRRIILPSMLLALGTADASNDKYKRQNSGLIGTPAPLSVALELASLADRNMGESNHVVPWRISTFTLIAQPSESESDDEWSSLLRTMRMPLVFVGLAVGVLYQVWVRSRRHREDQPDWAPPPPTGTPDRSGASEWPGAGGGIMKTLLRGMEGSSSFRSGAISQAMANAAGLRLPSQSTPGDTPSSSSTADWIRAALGETGGGQQGAVQELRRAEARRVLALHSEAQRLPLEQKGDIVSDVASAMRATTRQGGNLSMSTAYPTGDRNTSAVATAFDDSDSDGTFGAS